MTNHPHRANTIFQRDGHTGDWLVYGGQLRLRERADGSALVIGQTRTEAAGIARIPLGDGRRAAQIPQERVILTQDTPRIFRPLVGREFATMKEARAAVIEAAQAPARAKAAANTARLVAAGYPADISGKARDAALKALASA